MGRLVINGDEVYELDEACLKEKGALQNSRRGAVEREKNSCGNCAGERESHSVRNPRIR